MTVATVNLEQDNLKHGVLGLVLALVEIIRDALRLQAMRRIEAGSLTEEEVERLGRALGELDAALDQMKQEQGVAEAVKTLRDGLDRVVDEVVDQMVNPGRWQTSSAAPKRALT